MYTISYGIPLKFLLAPHPHPYFAFTTSVYFNANMSEGTWVKWVLLFNDERRIFHWSSNYLVWNGWYIIQQPFAYFWNLLDDYNSQITPPQKCRLIKAKLRTCPFLLSTNKNVLLLTKHEYRYTCLLMQRPKFHEWVNSCHFIMVSLFRFCRWVIELFKITLPI